ncbi:golgin subfamily A member 6-like protein 6 [Mercenaria mercenaria]|uniref:golgin subfamily A member 6-like protein 6 n=1 Tax=Mercenaria mercenaria TaxID=6596 RepID=UPI00234FAC7F|nr:golgin subfamily A member 6-like protein 6 [Mercenaria mercenaria]
MCFVDGERMFHQKVQETISMKAAEKAKGGTEEFIYKTEEKKVAELKLMNKTLSSIDNSLKELVSIKKKKLETEIENNFLHQQPLINCSASKCPRELDRIYTEHKEAQVEQQKLYESKLEKEKERADEHQRKLEEERKESMKKQEEKLADIQHQWDQQREISETEIKMMREENESQKKEFQEKINKMAADHIKKEDENRMKFDKMLKEDNAMAEKYVANVRDHFETMLDAEAKKSAEMEKSLQLLIQKIKEEKKTRKEMERENIRKMEEYDAKIAEIEKVMKESEGREDEMNAELQRLRKEKGEYGIISNSAGLQWFDFIPGVNLAARSLLSLLQK